MDRENNKQLDDLFFFASIFLYTYFFLRFVCYYEIGLHCEIKLIGKEGHDYKNIYDEKFKTPSIRSN